MEAKRREKLIEWGRHALAVFGGGAMICFASFLQLVGLIRAEILFLLVILFGVLIGMMATELHHALFASLLALPVGILMLFQLVLLPIPGAASWSIADVLIYFAIDSVVRTLHLVLVALLIGAVIGRVIGPDWYPVKIARHQLKLPVPEKEEA